MDHETATRMQAAERYILGELTPPEREGFEEHAADCSVCLRQLEAADIFAANATAVFEDRAAAGAVSDVGKSGRWFDFLRPRAFPVLAFSGAMNVALLLLVGYGSVQLRTGSRPGVAEEFTVRPPSRGGAAQVCAVRKETAFVTMQFDLARRFERYSYSLEGGDTGLGTIAPGAETVRLTLPAGGLQPGDHKFQFRGWDGQNRVEIGECLLRIEPAR